jgi:hypothetical protein
MRSIGPWHPCWPLRCCVNESPWSSFLRLHTAPVERTENGGDRYVQHYEEKCASCLVLTSAQPVQTR